MILQLLCALILSNTLIETQSSARKLENYTTGNEELKHLNRGKPRAILVYDDEPGSNEDPNIISENLDDLPSDSQDRVEEEEEEYEPPNGSNHNDFEPSNHQQPPLNGLNEQTQVSRQPEGSGHHVHDILSNVFHKVDQAATETFHEKNDGIKNGLDSIVEAGHKNVNNKKDVIHTGLSSLGNVWSHIGSKVTPQRQNDYHNRKFNVFY